MDVKFRLGEIFCGPGGLALGAKRAVVTKGKNNWSIEPAWASDADFDSCVTHTYNIHSSKPEKVRHCKVEDLDFSALPEIDAFAFGFPCNDYSVVGERKGVNGRYGPLYKYGVKGLNVFKPKWFFAENVRGLSDDAHSETFERMLEEFEQAGDGYAVTPHLYKFEQYGVPQKRHRIIIIGISKKFSVEFKVPAPTTPEPSQWVTAKHALSGMHSLLPNHDHSKIYPHIKARIANTPAGHNAWSKEIPMEHRLKGVKGARLSNIYKRLVADQPSYTVTGTGGGGTHMYHWDEPRPLTSREKARLQSFPDDFIFFGGKDSVRRQVGMAVPPAGAQLIIEAILKTFAGIEYPSVEAKVRGDRAKKVPTARPKTREEGRSLAGVGRG